MMQEIEELEPKNILEYIFKGSGLNQYCRKHFNQTRSKKGGKINENRKSS